MTYVITTFDWVPEMAVGYVRDLRIRWALNEVGAPYQVEATSIKERTAAHLLRQPFGQVPILRDGDLSIFESGAILLYLGERYPALLPQDEKGRAETQQWLIAALNSLEPVVLALTTARVFDCDEAAVARALPRVHDRLRQLEPVLAERDFIAAGRFTLADILLADVLRLLGARGELGSYPALTDYVARMTARPAFARALADQRAHFAGAVPA